MAIRRRPGSRRNRGHRVSTLLIAADAGRRVRIAGVGRAPARERPAVQPRRRDRHGEQGLRPDRREPGRAVPQRADLAVRPRHAVLRDPPSLAAELPGADRRLDVQIQERLPHVHGREEAEPRGPAGARGHLVEGLHELHAVPLLLRARTPTSTFGATTRSCTSTTSRKSRRGATASSPWTRWRTTSRTATLPRFVWITPNLCEDMHDCPVSSGDEFLSQQVPALIDQLGPNGRPVHHVRRGRERGHSGCCSGAKGGHIPTIVVGPNVAPGTTIDTPLDHYSILQTIEEGLALPRLRRASCSCTPSMDAFFTP